MYSHTTKIQPYLWACLILLINSLYSVNAQIPVMELDYNFDSESVDAYIYHLEVEFQQLRIDDFLQDGIQEAFTEGKPQAANFGINDHTFGTD